MSINRLHFPAVAAVALVALLIFTISAANAQTTTATLTGTVADVSGAVVPGATVNLRNESSGDLRKTVSNGNGYFTFAAVPPGTYDVRVESSGFVAWEAKSVVLTAGDMRSVTGIKLAPSGQVETVEVDAAGNQITPVDTGEKSVLINEHILQNVPIVGQNAAEFIKIMPGMAFTGGVVNQSSYAASDERTGSGPVGSFSANGTRTAALDITSDGAHIIDPGCNCGQAMNTNADMTAELKVMTSNFGADEAKGPVVISVIGKSGGQQFHGELYLYARYFSVNANDPQNKDSNIARPETKYLYPGFQISGPVILPHSDFNRNRDKMFFFFGTEYYKQDVDNGVYHAVVPTMDMRNGIYNTLAANPANGNGCPYYTQQQDPKTLKWSAVQHTENCYTSALNGSAVTGIPGGPNFQTQTITFPDGTSTNVTTGVMKPGVADPNGQILTNLYPLPNQDPATHGGFN